MRHSHDRTRFRRIGTAMLTTAMAGLILAACGGGKPSANTSTSTTATSATTAPAGGSTTTPVTPSTSIPFSISQVHRGTGPATLASFTVPSKAKEWDIDWVYFCSSSPTTTGTFKITVVGHGSAANTTDAGVSEPSGVGTAGIVKNYDTGSFNLKVTTACQWTVRVEVIN